MWQCYSFYYSILLKNTNIVNKFYQTFTKKIAGRMARSNLSSHACTPHFEKLLGEGTFRESFGATYNGGNRNKQDAVLKRFKYKYRTRETEYFRFDREVVDRVNVGPYTVILS